MNSPKRGATVVQHHSEGPAKVTPDSPATQIRPLFLPEAPTACPPFRLVRHRRQRVHPQPVVVDGDERAQRAGGEAGPSDELAWYRWVTGHQVMFALWQLTASVLRRGETDRQVGLPSPTTPMLRVLVHGATLAMIYTSSVSMRTYDTVIRPALVRQHPCFSGTWARDYLPVKEFFQGRLPGEGTRLPRELQKDVKLFHHVHIAVARRLVPGGVSLLQSGSTEAPPGGDDEKDVLALYDCTFVTVREQVGHEEVVGQLLSRLRHLRDDLATTGLHGLLASDVSEVDDPYGDEQIAALSSSLPASLAALGTTLEGAWEA